MTADQLRPIHSAGRSAPCTLLSFVHFGLLPDSFPRFLRIPERSGRLLCVCMYVCVTLILVVHVDSCFLLEGLMRSVAKLTGSCVSNPDGRPKKKQSIKSLEGTSVVCPNRQLVRNVLPFLGNSNSNSSHLSKPATTTSSGSSELPALGGVPPKASFLLQHFY